MPGGPGQFPTPGSLGSGRADFRHPALHHMDLLKDDRGRVQLVASAEDGSLKEARSVRNP